jgi:hypothetical protein
MFEGISKEMVAVLFALLGALLGNSVQYYAARRTVSHRRNRMKADLEILEKAEKLGVPNAPLIRDWLQNEFAKIYKLKDGPAAASQAHVKQSDPGDERTSS